MQEHAEFATRTNYLKYAAAAIIAIGVSANAADAADRALARREIRVLKPKQLSKSTIPCVRTRLGKSNDYKPWIAKLKNGDLLIVAFSYGEELTLESDQLRSEPAEMIADQQYELWVADTLQPGTELTFTIAPPGLTLTPGQIGLLAAGAGLLLAVAGSLAGGGSAEYRARQRREVIAAIAVLDDSHEAGDIGDGDYFHGRGRELDRLALLDAGKRASGHVSG